MASVHFARTRGGLYIGASMVDRSFHRAVRARCPLMLSLFGRHRNVLVTSGRRFCLGRTSRSSSRPSIEARAVVRGVIVRDRCVVNVVYHGRVHVRDSFVVIVLVASPGAAVKACVGIAESVVNAAIKPNGWSPVTRIPDVEAVYEAPISRRPQQSDFRRQNPSAGNPVIADVVAVGPIPRHPDVAGSRTDWLGIDRQEGWTYSHTYRDTNIYR